jgi:rhodanese-related sulfurtransferase
MGRINTLGPERLQQLDVPELTAAAVHARLGDVHVVDLRPRSAFAAGHIPSSVGIELADDFGTWVGWLVPFNAPLVLVMDDDQDVHEAVVHLQRIGFDRIQGVLRGVSAWRDAGYDVSSYKLTDAPTFARAVKDGNARQVLDVRSPAEWEAGSLPGAQWRYVPELVDGVPGELAATQPVWVLCASGFRASIAAGLLQRHGYTPIVLANGGVADVLGALADPTGRE